jgi:hypothetical protein
MPKDIETEPNKVYTAESSMGLQALSVALAMLSA